MKDRFLNQAKRAYGPRQRFWALLFLAPVFLLLLPLALIALGTRLERIQPGGDEVNGRVNDLAIYGMFDYRWRGESHPLAAKHRARGGAASGT